MSKSKYSTVIRGIQAVLLAYPILLLTVKGGMSASQIFLLGFSAYLLISTPLEKVKSDLDNTSIKFGLAISATFISVLVSQLYHWDMSAKAFDSPARFLLAFPIFLALRNLPPKTIGFIQYGFPLGAILIAGIIWMSEQAFYAETYFIHHIHLGDLALMLGILSISCINWTQKDNLLTLTFKTSGLFAGLYVSLASSARGGWIAIPIFLIILALRVPNQKKLGFVKWGFVAAFLITISVLSFNYIGTVQIRTKMTILDLASASPDSSLGVRFQLWRAAMHLFWENPVFGIGADGFGLAMEKMTEENVISKGAAIIGKGEIHNYFFAELARFGLVGLAATIFLFSIPFRMFCKATVSDCNFHRVSGWMGIAFVVGFFIFCMSVEMFNLKMIASFYAVTVSILLAAATNQFKDNDVKSS